MKEREITINIAENGESFEFPVSTSIANHTEIADVIRQSLNNHVIRFAFVIPGKHGVVGARYKYLQLFKEVTITKLFFEAHFQTAREFKPNYLVVFGDSWGTYRLALNYKMPYLLCEHDVATLRKSDNSTALKEKNKIRHARKIIFTSPDHQNYITKKYNYPRENTMVLYLRPSKQDLNFEPLPKLEGKHIVYIGGLMDKRQKGGKFGYRSYHYIFQAFIDNGWTVHLYPIRQNPYEYQDMGCIIHEPVKEGKELFRELSQYTCGLQTFNRSGVPENAYNYSQTCRPNKLWNYLAAGIPTIGYQGGNGMELYRDKWGIVINGLSEISAIEERISKLNLAEFREKEVIESQLEELKIFLEII